MCMRFRETAGPSEHLVPSGVGGLRRSLLRTERKHCTRALAGVFRIELVGPGEQDVAVGEIEGPGVAVMRKEAGQQPGLTRLDSTS